MSTVSLDIVTTGWELPGWGQAFYPEDLPLDWRLTYFANEFPAVLIPAEHWTKADESGLRTWRENVHEGFRFYLADPGPQAARGGPDLARHILGVKLAGLVLENQPQSPLDNLTRFQLLSVPAAAPAAGNLPAWRTPPDLIHEPRVARAWIEALDLEASGGSGLLVLGGAEIDADDLHRWWDLTRLMGVAA